MMNFFCKHKEEMESSLCNPQKKKFRPAIDVINRIKHDPNFDINQFIVGYEDR
jgi:hypothetical protein